MVIRKNIPIKETIVADGNRKASKAITRIVAIGMFQNPFAGRFMENLSPLFDIGFELGEQLMGDALKNLADPPVSYSKATIAGIFGDIEQGDAIIHPKLGEPMPAAVVDA